MIVDEKINETQIVSEFEELLKVYKDLNPSRVIEIGSLTGRALRHFMHYAKEGATVISLDLPVRDFCGPGDYRVLEQEHNYSVEWPRWAKEKNIKLYLIKGMSQNPGSLVKVKSIMTEVDFLFIDGNHFYEYVKKDLEMYGPLVKKGGIIALHDIGYAEEGGVQKLWEEIKNNYSSYKEIKHSPSGEKGIGLLYV
jgi:cephalosporin hydroxylase